MEKIECKFIRLERLRYNKIFIVENQKWWNRCSSQYDLENDLVLTLDFGLKRSIQMIGGRSEFLDHLLTTEFLESYNYEMHSFLSNWYKNNQGEDYFYYREIDFGNAFKLYINAEVTKIVHFFLNLKVIGNLHFSELICAVEDSLLITLLNLLYEDINWAKSDIKDNKSGYYFPISEWMEDNVEKFKLRYRTKNFLAKGFDEIFNIVDYISRNRRDYIYIQNYYPTTEIINNLKRDKNIRLVLRNYIHLKDILKERRIFFSDKVRGYRIESENILLKFKASKRLTWEIEDFVISDFIYDHIEPIIRRLLPICCSRIDEIQKFFRIRDLKLMIPVTDLWLENRLIMNYCKKNKIPIFMIINGMLSFNFESDALDADWVNCYSPAIKEDYFQNGEKAIPLGDPRMDLYSAAKPKTMNRTNPTIIIGSAGYNVIDLNSYLSFEFDFLFDILQSLRDIMIGFGMKFNIVLRLRTNCIHSQYIDFLNEYFGDLDVSISQNEKFHKIIEAADLYITSYSQTLFEASCLGIPVIYYKKDTQNVNRPFRDGTELVIAVDQESLRDKVKLFLEGDISYNEFLDKKVMEQYIGYLDGGNIVRNIDFIYGLL